MEQKQMIDMEKDTPEYELTTASEAVQEAFRILYQQCHASSYNRGWWHDPITGLSLIPHGENEPIEYMVEQMRTAWFPYVVATKIALVHSEVSEALEAYRTDAMDDKIKSFAGITAEFADTIIRICDLQSMLQDHTERFEEYDVGLAILEKIPFNGVRLDHSMEARKKPGGKKF